MVKKSYLMDLVGGLALTFAILAVLPSSVALAGGGGNP